MSFLFLKRKRIKSVIVNTPFNFVIGKIFPFSNEAGIGVQKVTAIGLVVGDITAIIDSRDLPARPIVTVPDAFTGDPFGSDQSVTSSDDIRTVVK